MGSGRAAMFSLAVLLALNGPSAAAANHVDQSLPYSEGITNGYFDYVQVGAVGASTTMTLVVSSNVSVSTALMNTVQFTSFNNSASDLSYSMFLQNASSVPQKTFHLPRGTYYIVFYAYDGNANVSYNEVTYPIDPYLYTPLPPPEPTGVASYGVYNESGAGVPYQVSSSEVVGIATIDALQAYNSSAGSASSNPSGATLQLNAVIQVDEKGGRQQVYWAQNTPDFTTATDQVAWGDNLWNFSVSGYMSNSTVTSSNGGYVSSAGPGTAGDYYGQEVSNTTYNFPFVLALLMNETVMPGHGIFLEMGSQVLENGTGSVSGVSWFDNITINEPTVQSATFLVSGNQTVAGGLYYDTELIFGGENNGEETNFNQMSASLGIFYENSTTRSLEAYPSVYSFGGDTAESADNLQVSAPVNGFSQVTTGTPDYVYLGSVSRSLTMPLTISEVATNSSLTQTGTSSNETSSSGATQSTSSSSSSSSSVTTASSSSTSTSLALSPAAAFALAASASAVLATLAVGGRVRNRHHL